MRGAMGLVVAGLALLAARGLVLADEPMDGTFTALRSCEALLSIRKDTNPGHVITGPGISYRLLAKNQKLASYYRIEVPGAEPPERWVPVDCGRIAAAADNGKAGGDAAPAKPKPADRDYVLALSWEPAFCESNPNKPECRWQTNSRYDANYLSLHGLWPQPEGLAYCNVSPKVRAAAEGGRWKDIPPVTLSMPVQADLEKMMPGSASMLERHEYAKHGTCYPADAETYFRDSFRLLTEVNASPVADLFLKAKGRRVTAADIRSAFDQGFGTGAGQRVRVACRDDGDRRLISEITIGLRGNIPSGTRLSDLILAAEPVEPGCPAGLLDPVGTQ